MDELFLIDATVHGRAAVRFAWHPRGDALATSGTNRVYIFDCHGRLLDQVPLGSAGSVSALEWDATGACLAIAQYSTATVTLWFSGGLPLRTVDVSNGCGSRDVNFLKWSHDGEHLAAGTGKGVLCIYNRRAATKLWATGRHKRRILCGAWSAANTLAYASEDRQISICNELGETHDQVKVKSRPTDVAFGGRRAQADGVVSVNMEGRTILLYNLSDQDNALELAFQARYGAVIGYAWLGDGHIVAAFANGYVVVISTHLRDIAREQYCVRFHNDEVTAMAHCAATHKLATCGGDCVKLIDVRDRQVAGESDASSGPQQTLDLREIKTHRLEKENGQLTSVAFSADGRLLAVGSRGGAVYTYAVRCGGGDVTHLYPHPGLARAVKPLPVLQLAFHVCLVLLGAAAVMAVKLGVPLRELVIAVLWDPGTF